VKLVKRPWAPTCIRRAVKRADRQVARREIDAEQERMLLEPPPGYCDGDCEYCSRPRPEDRISSHLGLRALLGLTYAPVTTRLSL
jgi:hypothetical protein